MPKSYARLDDKSIVQEIIHAYVDEHGVEYPIDQMFLPEFVASLIDLTNANMKPSVGFWYEGGVFQPPIKEDLQPTKEEIEKLRLIAYADPVTGIDRHFAEVLSLQAEGFAASSTEVKDAKARGLARKVEIQALYPYPVE